MKSKLSKWNEFDPKEGFMIRHPKWFICLCLAISVVFLIISIQVFCLFYTDNQAHAGGVFYGLFFLGLSVLCAVVAYIYDYEKLSYADRIYKYYRPFGKNRIAAVEEIGSVKILTFYRIKGRGSGKKIWIFFYDKNGNILIKMNDDGTVFAQNETFLKSLKYNRIKIIREEKYDY